MFTLQMITDGGPDARNAAQPALGQGQLGGQAVKPDEQAVRLRYCQVARQRRGPDAVVEQAAEGALACSGPGTKTATGLTTGPVCRGQEWAGVTEVEMERLLMVDVGGRGEHGPARQQGEQA